MLVKTWECNPVNICIFPFDQIWKTIISVKESLLYANISLMGFQHHAKCAQRRSFKPAWLMFDSLKTYLRLVCYLNKQVWTYFLSSLTFQTKLEQSIIWLDKLIICKIFKLLELGSIKVRLSLFHLINKPNSNLFLKLVKFSNQVLIVYSSVCLPRLPLLILTHWVQYFMLYEWCER